MPKTPISDHDRIWGMSFRDGIESWSDIGNASRFMDKLVDSTKRPIYINGNWWFLLESYPAKLASKWYCDENQKIVHQYATDIVEEMARTAKTDAEKRFAAESGNLPRIKAMIKLASWQAKSDVFIEPKQDETEADFEAREAAFQTSDVETVMSLSPTP